MAATTNLNHVLLDRHPASFAGVRQAGDGSFEVLFTDPPSNIEQELAAYYEQTAPSGVKPEIRIAQVERTLAELERLADSINDDAPELEQAGLPANVTASPDILKNKVLVQVPSSNFSQDHVLTDRYGEENLTILHMVLTASAGRYDDVPPWNGGNKIDSGIGTCTTGFGAHDGAGNRFLITAGHCQGFRWYNTATEDYSPSNELGTSDTRFTPFNSPYDTMRIFTFGGSSRLVWQGDQSTTTRAVVSDSAWGSVGIKVCTEGSVSGESCGVQRGFNGDYTVFYPESGTSSVVSGASSIWYAETQDGDSGGSVIWPTGYGPLAVSTVIASGITFIQGGEEIPTTVVQEVKVSEYALGVTVNSINNP